MKRCASPHTHISICSQHDVPMILMIIPCKTMQKFAVRIVTVTVTVCTVTKVNLTAHKWVYTPPTSFFGRSLAPSEAIYHKHKLKPSIWKKRRAVHELKLSSRLEEKEKRHLTTWSHRSSSIRACTLLAQLVIRFEGLIWKMALVNVLNYSHLLSFCPCHTSCFYILEQIVASCINLGPIPKISNLKFATSSPCPCITFWSY